MRILVTGVNGLVGRAIVEELYVDFSLVGLSRTVKPVNANIDYVYCDLSQTDFLNTFKNQSFDVIIHAAASTSKDPLSMDLISSNCMATRNIAYLANELGCKNFIYLSGVTVIGKPQEIPITEEHPVKSCSTYLLTKHFGEEYFRLTLDEKCKYTVLRLTSPLGKGLPDSKIIPTFVRNAISGKNIILSGNGSRVQNYVDVRDVAKAIKLVIDNNVDGIYNIAGVQSYTNKQVAEICIDLFQSKSKVVYNGLTDKEEDFKWYVSIEKAKRRFGYMPQYSIFDSIAELANSNSYI